MTTLEHLARCPWKSFLEKQLRLAPPADVWGPLPQGGERLLIGRLVHRVLEAVAEQAGIPVRQPIDALRARPPQPLTWPDAAALDPVIERCAEALAREEGLAIPSFARALACVARGYLEVARRAEDAGSSSVLGVESRGVVRLADAQGRLREIHFVADRVDVIEGMLRITDYKTGNPKAEQKDADRRADALRKRVASGAQIQASAYAFSGGSVPLEGRYLFLDPDTEEHARRLVAPTSSEDRDAFEQAVRTLLAGLDAGCFLPRLRGVKDDKEPFTCTSCEVKDACLRGDSGARARLGAWAEAEPAGSAVETAARALWSLGE